jgi:hypothetical protein
VDVVVGAARGEEFLVPGFAGGDEGERRKLRSAATAGEGVRHAEGEETPEESRETGLGVATLGLALDLGFGFGLEEAAVVVALGLAMADWALL